MPAPPKILDKVIASDQPPQVLVQGGFLTLVRRQARNLFTDGTMGPWYEVESVLPRFSDAVVLLLYSREPDGGLVVALRQGARPSLCLRADDPLWRGLDQGLSWDQGLWELPAGGVEAKDLQPSGEGLSGRASQEAWEEAGLRVEPRDFFPLGPAPLQAPAFCPERLHYLVASVDPAQAQPPQGDGHPMEQGARVVFMPLTQALAWCQEGRIIDTKTEVGLHRLARWEAEQACSGNQPEKP